jgi:hypothetical protein
MQERLNLLTYSATLTTASIIPIAVITSRTTKQEDHELILLQMDRSTYCSKKQNIKKLIPDTLNISFSVTTQYSFYTYIILRTSE